MRSLAILTLCSLFLLQGCFLFKRKGGAGKGGELTGVTGRKGWEQPEPHGMVVVPAGSYHIGQNDQDVNYSQIAPKKQITVSAFYMDDGEITNNEYRQFLEASVDAGTGEPKDDSTSGGYFTAIKDFMKRTYNKDIEAPLFKRLISPDTLSWVRDFTYTYNEPIVENYFWHPAFDDYPVVGVDWYAAQIFCYWRTKFYNGYRDERQKPRLPRFRLPSEAEWEYAARGGYEHKLYPWEGLYLRNSKGCFLANFKNNRGDYIEDLYSYTSPTKAYFPNDYGLYDMSGNAAEWCEDDFEETAYTYVHDLNPVYRDKTGKNQRRVVRGGSWKDIGYFLSLGTRTYEYADTAKCYIGFRTVTSIIGPAGATR